MAGHGKQLGLITYLCNLKDIKKELGGNPSSFYSGDNDIVCKQQRCAFGFANMITEESLGKFRGFSLFRVF